MAVTFEHIAEPGPDECTARRDLTDRLRRVLPLQGHQVVAQALEDWRLSCGSSILSILFRLFLRWRWNAGLQGQPLAQAWMALR